MIIAVLLLIMFSLPLAAEAGTDATTTTTTVEIEKSVEKPVEKPVETQDPKQVEKAPAIAPGNPERQAEAAFEVSRPYTVNLPGGWDVSELKAPRPKNGRDMLGGRLRAIKKDDGGMAVIEITHMPKPSTGEQPDLAYEFGRFIETIKSEYRNQALEVTTGDAKPSTIGNLPAEEVEITVSGKNQQLRQWFAMAIGKDYVFALSFTGQKDYFEKLRPEFEKCRESIVIK